MAPRAETDDPRLVQQAEIMEEDFVIQVRAIADKDPAMKRLQQADWPMLQRNDNMACVRLGVVPDGMKRPYVLCQKDFVIKQQMLYLKTTPSNK